MSALRAAARVHAALTGPTADVSFGFTRDPAGDITLSRAGEPRQTVGLRRRDFLVRFCQGAGASLIPARLWGLALPEFSPLVFPAASSAEAGFQLHPHYRSARPLDTTLLKVQTGLDEFVIEKYADEIAAILADWSASLLGSPRAREAVAKTMAPDFLGASLLPAEFRVVRSGSGLEVRENKFSRELKLKSDTLLQQFQSSLEVFSRITIAEFQITGIEKSGMNTSFQRPSRLEARIRYEIVGEGGDFLREQRVGYWDLAWAPSPAGLRLHSWRASEETQARSHSPVYMDITAAVLGNNSSYSSQMLHGVDYWRTVLDGACGIDIYGHNGVSVADIDNDGFDDLYVCQPAGLPNRLYRNRGDGTFEDITEASGLGILENTACALFVDFSNNGRQDVILVRANGPLFFVNEGGGKFRQKPDAFQFANPPQGTFTGAAVADYDRDGWLDVYFCLYSYYQGTGQYRYPLPYHDAENGPPNFLMRNNRDGTFRDVTAESGLNQNNTRYSFACAWSDFNRDGWPDLYVVNDFGRKNLYRNNGDGTFSDIAPQVGAEDVGAGMSACWLDYDNDGAQDLYVANMWTAAGERITAQEIFKKDSPEQVRALYHKHAMGNSLLRNHGATFDEATHRSGAGLGRWAWSSDSFDFDHDGFPDLYIANGFVSNPSRQDLNSFFWRQVVARSPDDARSSPDYEQGWNAINELIRADGTWSGCERNIFYANNRDGTFSDVSAAVGLDFVEDGRSFAVTDIDHDGRLEVVLKNRNAPQLRVLKNVIQDLPPALAFRLQGTRSNRDAIGASITIETDAGRQTRMLQAGSGFLSQHSKDVFFGLGATKGPVRPSIRWPSGLVQELQNLPVNHRIWVEEGEEPSRLEPFQAPASNRAHVTTAIPAPEAESLPTTVDTWLLAPVSAADFSLPDLSERTRTLSTFRGNPVLLNFWVTKSPDCVEDLKTLQMGHSRWATQGLQLLTVNLDAAADSAQAKTAPGATLHAFARDQRLTFPILRGTDDIAAIYNILYRQLFDRHRDLTLPTSFLIDAQGDIVKVYQGPLNPEHVEQDIRRIPRAEAERLALALPFPSATQTLDFGRNYLSLGALFFQRGYLDEAGVSFQQAFRDDPSSAEALYGIGTVYLHQNKNGIARQTFERVVKFEASYPDTLPDAWNNLGVIGTREGRVDDSIQCFQQALRLNPHHLLALDNLGNAYRLQKRWDEARAVLKRALEVAPQDPEANYSLGMVFAQANDTGKAYEYLQRALKARPDYPEALNNLGILYLLTQRRDDAVASFEQCIRVAPAFDQAYLNLARVYALEGARDKARSILLDLLKQHPDHAQAKEMLEQLQQ
jgi:tetratricopeptide (TPR) repeat protein